MLEGKPGDLKDGYMLFAYNIWRASIFSVAISSFQLQAA
jgi:hypothetical protein